MLISGARFATEVYSVSVAGRSSEQTRHGESVPYSVNAGAPMRLSCAFEPGEGRKEGRGGEGRRAYKQNSQGEGR